MEKQKLKIETSFKTVEERLGQVGELSVTDKKQEIGQLRKTMQELDSEVQLFQRNAYMHYPDECEEFDQRFSDLSHRLNQAAGDGVAINLPDTQKPIESEYEGFGATQQQIQQTNDKLKEGKSRALAMLQTVNNMKEEINQIDDEVMFQREKLLGVSERLKETQNMLRQTKRLVNFFSKAVYEDLIIKILIGLIAVAVLIILIMAVRIKMRKGNIEKVQIQKDEEMVATANYDDIDENEFAALIDRYTDKSDSKAKVKLKDDKTLDSAAKPKEAAVNLG